MLERKIDAYLSNWKRSSQRKPLIVKGARQIGKTESIRAFGKANYESVIEINFVLRRSSEQSLTTVTKSIPSSRTSR